LNESAAAIVKRCDGARTVEQIIEEVARDALATGTERAQIERDVIEFIGALADKGLLEPQ